MTACAFAPFTAQIAGFMNMEPVFSRWQRRERRIHTTATAFVLKGNLSYNTPIALEDCYCHIYRICMYLQDH
jgi:hypothetical protein